MKIFLGIIAWLIGIYYFVCGLLFYLALWGGIGFFGALVTTPVSTGIYVLIATFTSWAGFGQNILLLGAMGACFYYSQD